MMVVSLYTSRIVLDALGVVDFGLYNVVGGIVVALGFLSGTLNTASSRFITVSLSKGCLEEMKKTFSNVLFVNILLAVIVLIAGETVGLWFLYNKLQVPPERFNAAFWVYQMSIVTVMINIISSAYNACIIAHEKMKAFAYFSLFDCFAKLLIAYALFITNYDKLIIYGALLLTVQIIDRIVYGAYCTRKFNETRTKIILDRPLLTQMFKFISWASYGSFVSIGFTQGLNILINLFFGPAINAARAVSVQVQNAVVSFTTNFQTAINPQLIQSVAKYMSADKGLLKLGVMATEATVKTKTYTKEFKKYNPDIEVIEQACPLWVPIVEKHLTNYDEKQAIYGYLKNVLEFNPQKIILGCTHYPYLMDKISKYAPRELFINPAQIFARYIIDDLKQNSLINETQTGSVHYYASSNPDNFRQNAKMFLEIDETPLLVEI